jgi:hypothetical protein
MWIELSFFKSKSLEIIIWFTPSESLMGNAIAISFIGVLLAPMFPMAMNYAACILPRRILTGSLGLVRLAVRCIRLWQARYLRRRVLIVYSLCEFFSFSLDRLEKWGINIDFFIFIIRLIAMMGIMIVLWAVIPLATRRVDLFLTNS